MAAKLASKPGRNATGKTRPRIAPRRLICIVIPGRETNGDVQLPIWDCRNSMMRNCASEARADAGRGEAMGSRLALFDRLNARYDAMPKLTRTPRQTFGYEMRERL